jgi:hypothetical protein
VTLAEGCTLTGLRALTSLDGLTLAEGCGLYGLSSVTSLAGLTMATGCVLGGLSSVTSLDGLTMAERCRLSGLSPAMRAELAKLRRAPYLLATYVWCRVCGCVHESEIPVDERHLLDCYNDTNDPRGEGYYVALFTEIEVGGHAS